MTEEISFPAYPDKDFVHTIKGIELGIVSTDSNYGISRCSIHQDHDKLIATAESFANCVIGEREKKAVRVQILLMLMN